MFRLLEATQCNKNNVFLFVGCACPRVLLLCESEVVVKEMPLLIKAGSVHEHELIRWCFSQRSEFERPVDAFEEMNPFCCVHQCQKFLRAACSILQKRPRNFQ